MAGKRKLKKSTSVEQFSSEDLNSAGMRTLREWGREHGVKGRSKAQLVEQLAQFASDGSTFKALSPSKLRKRKSNTNTKIAETAKKAKKSGDAKTQKPHLFYFRFNSSWLNFDNLQANIKIEENIKAGIITEEELFGISPPPKKKKSDRRIVSGEGKGRRAFLVKASLFKKLREMCGPANEDFDDYLAWEKANVGNYLDLVL